MPQATPDPMAAYHVAAVRELLAAIRADDCTDDRRAYGLLGRTEAVLAGLLDTIDGDRAEREAARRSVDRAFPVVAAFLATERGEQR